MDAMNPSGLWRLGRGYAAEKQSLEARRLPTRALLADASCEIPAVVEERVDVVDRRAPSLGQRWRQVEARHADLPVLLDGIRVVRELAAARRNLEGLGFAAELLAERAQLLDGVWGYGHDGYEHTVNSHINRLRAKVERDPANPELITTVWGVGYKLDVPPVPRPRTTGNVTAPGALSDKVYRKCAGLKQTGRDRAGRLSRFSLLRC